MRQGGWYLKLVAQQSRSRSRVRASVGLPAQRLQGTQAQEIVTAPVVHLELTIESIEEHAESMWERAIYAVSRQGCSPDCHRYAVTDMPPDILSPISSDIFQSALDNY